MSLLSLPDELLHLCSFHLLAHKPLGPPSDLITLALVCRAFNNAVSSHTFRARICRFMFDTGAVSRRLFHPRDSDLADELHRCCNLLKAIRRADLEESEEETLIEAYILMLSNDGKNYAQLEHAGLDAYLDKYINTRLWSGRETNQGWPLDNIDNASALWLMWMTMTKQKLAAESPETRMRMAWLTVPYVVIPHRYASASAPPNHFNLPLDPKNPNHQQPLIRNADSETPYPIYLHDRETYSLPYFNARIPVASPLITIAAKLLFVARKEVLPVRPPPHLPLAPGPGIVGPTQEDFKDINSAARLCTLVTWNWVTGSPNRVGGVDGDPEIAEGWEQSKVWDTEWWRRLLCRRFNVKRPKYLPGELYQRGSMKGSWIAKEYAPLGNRFIQFLNQPNIPYPGIPDEEHPDLFTEDSIGLSLNLVFLEIQEYHKICECPKESPNISESHPYVPATYTTSTHSVAPSTTIPPTSLPIVPESGRCGIVPIPAPLVFQSTTTTANPGQNEEEQEGTEASDAITRSLPPPRISVIDYSMSNAWFPGHLGGVTFTKFQPFTGDGRREKVICSVDHQTPDIRSVLNRPEESECLSLGGRRQQEDQGKMNAYVYEAYDPEKMSMHRGLGDPISDAFTSTTSHDYTNETDPHKCQRCLQREALIRLERKEAERRSKMMLDRELRSFGSRDGYNWHQDVGYDNDEDMDDDEEDEEMGDGDEDEEYEDGDEDMRDLDVDEMGFDMDEIIAQATASRSTSSTGSVETDDDSTSSSQLVSFGDENTEHKLGIDKRSRNYYDKCRIGVECSGVADVLLSGETGPRHAAIARSYRMYGRVRPWDGLIGILKSVGDRAHNNITSNIFVFGYIVGENNFVGEWRVAAADPLSPTWGSAFVMSRKVVDGGKGGGQA